MSDRPYFIFYDGQCRVCRRGRQMIERLGPLAEVRFVDVNDASEMAAHPALATADVLGQMHVMDPEGRVSGGYDALVALAPILPAVRWLRRVLAAAPVRTVGSRAYRWVAANRYRLGGQRSCHGGACRIRPPARLAAAATGRG